MADTPRPKPPALDLDEVRALAEAATPGPWQSWRDGNQYVDVTWKTKYGTQLYEHLCGASIVKPLQRPWSPFAYKKEDPNVVRLRNEDADFIARARTLVPQLCAELAAARAEVERLKAQSLSAAILGKVVAVLKFYDGPDGNSRSYVLEAVRKACAAAEAAEDAAENARAGGGK